MKRSTRNRLVAGVALYVLAVAITGALGRHDYTRVSQGKEARFTFVGPHMLMDGGTTFSSNWLYSVGYYHRLEPGDRDPESGLIKADLVEGPFIEFIFGWPLLPSVSPDPALPEASVLVKGIVCIIPQFAVLLAILVLIDIWYRLSGKITRPPKPEADESVPLTSGSSGR